MSTPASITLDLSQARAVDLMCSAKLGIVTGGPGTGKSTCTRYALDQLDAMGKRYLLAAPTGKAAKRFSETTGREAKTIHRLLEPMPPTGRFSRDALNPLDTDVVLIDESSMIDTELGAALVKAVDPTRTSLILIGDADQLPPVGPGRVFGDLVDSGLVPVARLTTLHRSALESWIHVNAQRVLKGEPLDLSPRKDFRFVDVGDDATKILPAVVNFVLKQLPSIDDSMSQILIPQKTKLAGIEACNRLMQSALNPKREGAPFISRGKDLELRAGDRVIQTKNDYKLDAGQGVFNGELGDIAKIDKDGVFVEFPDRGVQYSLAQAEALQLAYALTVHRFQGSEVPWAVCVIHSTHSNMLTRQLIYTAITRGKKGVIIVGNQAGIDFGLKAFRPPPRNTGLLERIKGHPDFAEAKAS
jgi:exodeoxyribonuclease V alpha subunit